MLSAAAFGLLGAFTSRWHGGGWGKPPKLLAGVVWSVPFAVVAYFATSQVWAALIVFGLTLLFRQTGHGGAMDAGRSKKEPRAGREPEKLEHLILWLNGRIPARVYDALLNAVIGTSAVLPCAVAVSIASLPAGLVMLLGGMVGRPLSYELGHCLDDLGYLKRFPRWADHGSAIGELGYGLFVYVALFEVWRVL